MATKRVEAFQISARIEVDNRRAQAELRATEKQAKTTAGALAGLRGRFGDAAEALGGFVEAPGVLGKVAGAAGPAGAAIAGVGAAAFAAVGGVAALIKHTSDVGSRFNDFSIQTGLSVETLSGLERQLTQSGTSLEAFAHNTLLLQRNMASARSEGGDLAAAFKRLGVDLRGDTETAVRQVVAGLARIPDAAERNALGAKVMGRAYKELAVFIRDTNGDIDEVIAQARKAGLVMSGEAAAAADEFGDTLDALKIQLSAAGREMGSLPLREATGLMRDLSGEVAGQTGLWGALGEGIRDAVRDVRVFIRDIQSLASNPSLLVLEAYTTFNGLPSGVSAASRKAIEEEEAKAAGRRELQRAYKELDEAYMRQNRGAGDDFFSGEGKKKKQQRERDRKDELDKLKKFAEEWGFIVSVVGNRRPDGRHTRHNVGSKHYLGQAIDIDVRGKSDAEVRRFMAAGREAGYRVLDERVRPPGQKEWNKPHLHFELMGKAAQAARKDADALGEAVHRLADRARERGEQDERRAAQMRLEVEAQIHALTREETTLDRVNKLLAPAEVMGAVKAVTAEQLRRLAVLKDVEDTLRDIRDLEIQPTSGPFAAEEPYVPHSRRKEEGPAVDFGDFTREQGLAPKMKRGFEQVTGALRNLKDVGADALGSLASGVGSMVENWVLLGDESDASMKKMVASVLGGVTAQCATLAVMHTALGIAALTPWGAIQYGPAAMQFKAAALFGSIAVGTALGGRAVAGDSFKSKPDEQTRQQNEAFAEESHPANQFTRRWNGGPAYKGRAYIVGDGGRSEVFEPDEDGHVYPSVDAYERSQELRRKQRVLERGGLRGMEKLLHRALGRLADQIERMESMSPGEVVRLGAPKAKREIGAATVAALDGNGKLVEQMNRRLQPA